MRRSAWQRGLLAATLGLGVMAGLARGGEPVVSSSEAAPCEDCASDKVNGGPLRWLRPANWHKRFRDHPGVGCYAHHNDFSCSSLHSELRFILGSCRSFFGERCLKGPPPSPVPGFGPYGPEPPFPFVGGPIVPPPNPVPPPGY